MAKPTSQINITQISTNLTTFPMFEHDWGRLRRRISKIPKPSKLYSNLYSIFLGIAITTTIEIGDAIQEILDDMNSVDNTKRKRN